MPKYVIERDIPGAGKMTPQQLKAISQASCDVLTEMGLPYHWVQSFVTADKMYCIHIAPDEASVREHAQRGHFPITRVSEVKTIIDPSTAEI